MIDALREQRDLHIGRACIPFVELEIANCLRFRFHILHCGNLSRLLIVVQTVILQDKAVKLKKR